MRSASKLKTIGYHYALSSMVLVLCGCATIRTPDGQGWRQDTPTPPREPKHFERVLIIVLENQNYEDAIKDQYLGDLSKRGVNFTDFHGLFHPSYPNYLAMIAGKEIPTRGDIQRNIVDERTIADLLRSKGLRWKNYAEKYPGDSDTCFIGSRRGRYVRKHVPFISFKAIQDNECESVVDASQFDKDRMSGSLPAYAFYTPDLDNDGHDTGLAHSSQWLKRFLEPLLQDDTFNKETLVIVTYDESASKLRDSNHIYTVFLGQMVKPRPDGYGENYNHFNVLRTIEENFSLGTLAEGDGQARPITGVWK